MRSAGLPENEAERLAALRAYEVLDGPSTNAIDALVRVASAACGAPIALVSLVDAQRQWFLSAVGLGVKETPREVAFCSHAIHQRQLFEVPDSHADPRFSDNPLVTGAPHVRFYAGAPLVSPEGFALGTLCVIDHEPRKLDAAQQNLLSELSVAVVSLLEARKAEAERRKEAALLALAVEVAGLGHWRIDVKEAHLFWSSQVFAIHGLDPAGPMPGLETAIEVYHPDDRATVARLVERAMGTGEPFAFDLRIVRPTGEVRHVHSAGRPVLAEDGSCREVFGILQDNTDREVLRQRMVRNERLVTTGTLAAGVGHEINNPLTYTLANLDMALEEVRELSGGSPSSRMREIGELIAEAREGGERIRKIVRGLRAFARDEAEVVPTELRDAIEISVNMAMHELRQRATLVSELDPVPAVLADESRLSQVIVNLLVNAGQSFHASDPSRNRIWIRTRATAGAVILEVEDNGPGIRPEVLPRIFDPFFTTKPVGQGTGLGLAICQSVITSIGGELRCQTRLGEGTLFRVQLPVAPTQPLGGTQASAMRKSKGPRGQVLLVDDEETIIRAMTRLLSREHDVTSFTDPRDAVARLVQGPAFDVVFCDLMMPHMTGMDLFRTVEAARPEVAQRFVFVTGGVSEDLVRDFLGGVVNDRLDKPFTPQGLMSMARRYVGAHALSSKDRVA